MVSVAGIAAGEVARRLGIAVTTLRTWHQRYGLGPSGHLAGRHRRYTADDVARLEVMRSLTGQGVPTAEAARVAMSTQRGMSSEPGMSFQPGISARPDETDLTAARDGGGFAIPVGRAGRAARGLARAAMRLDGSTMEQVIFAAVSERGVVPTWERMLRPVLVGIGERQRGTAQLIEVEHLTSRSISRVLAAVPRPAERRAPRVLLACADEEQHTLPLEALDAALAERGCSSRLLGARVPATSLAEAVRRTGPAVVVVWSQTPRTGDVAQLRLLVATRPRPSMIAAAGPGWPADGVPAGVERPASLAEAVNRVLATALAGD